MSEQPACTQCLAGSQDPVSIQGFTVLQISHFSMADNTEIFVFSAGLGSRLCDLYVSWLGRGHVCVSCMLVGVHNNLTPQRLSLELAEMTQARQTCYNTPQLTAHQLCTELSYSRAVASEP